MSAKPEIEEDGDAAQAALLKERRALAEAVQELTTGTSMKDAIKWVFTLGLSVRTQMPNCRLIVEIPWHKLRRQRWRRVRRDLVKLCRRLRDAVRKLYSLHRLAKQVRDVS